MSEYVAGHEVGQVLLVGVLHDDRQVARQHEHVLRGRSTRERLRVLHDDRQVARQYVL